MAKIFLVCMLAVCGLMSSLADRDINEGDMNVKVLGKSGKISLKNKKGNGATVTFDYIKELSSAGTAVGTSGKNKHSIETFAKEQFTFKTAGLKTEYKNISVKSIQFSANISGPGAVLTVDIYIFKAAGNITTGNGEEITVKKGTVKFDISIAGWSFCGGGSGVGGGSCSQQEGTELELSIEIKGRDKHKPKESKRKRGKGRRMKTFDIGGGDATLSGQVKKDGVWQEMAQNYPKFETKGSKTFFKFRFPRFTNDVFYDPTFDMSTTGGAALAKGHMALISLCALLVILKLIA